jgi:hypothetical protein
MEDLDKHQKDSKLESYFKIARSVIGKFKKGQIALKTPLGEGLQAFQEYFESLGQQL